MDISVVIPAFNAATTIGETLESALAQTLPPREVLVIDDGSTDGTAEIARLFGPSVSVLTLENGGAARARNIGIARAGHPWIALLDADDIWEPNKLEAQARLTDRFPFVYTDAVIADGGPRKTVASIADCPSGRVLDRLLLNNVITTSSVLVRRDVLEEAGGFPEARRAISDWPAWLRIAARHPIGFVAEALVTYRVSPGGITRNISATLPAHLAVLEEAFADGGVAAHLRHLRREACANVYRTVGEEAGRSSQWALAARLYGRLLTLTPGDTGAWRNLAKVGLGIGGVRGW